MRSRQRRQMHHRNDDVIFFFFRLLDLDARFLFSLKMVKDVLYIASFVFLTRSPPNFISFFKAKSSLSRSYLAGAFFVVVDAICPFVERKKKRKRRRDERPPRPFLSLSLSSLSLSLSPSFYYLLSSDQPRRPPRRHHLFEQRLGVHHVIQRQHSRGPGFRVVEVEGRALVVGRVPGEDLPDEGPRVPEGGRGGGVGGEEGVAVGDVAVGGAEFLTSVVFWRDGEGEGEGKS